MNLPNKLTVLRILLIPVCLGLLLARLDIAAATVFALACLTDYLDGHIARSRGIVTNFGKFADPVADKILVVAVMIALLSQGRYPWWALTIVAMRELAVDGLRLVAVEQGVVIAAGTLGKFKTNAQFLSVLGYITGFPLWLNIPLAILMCTLTLLSGAQYFYGARALLHSGKQ